MTIMLPLFDSYAGPVRAQNIENPRLNPILAKLDTLPEDILLIIPTVDILLHEQLTFVERLKKETAEDPKKHSNRRLETLMIEGQFHGWNDCKLLNIKYIKPHLTRIPVPPFTKEMKRTKELALSTSMQFLKDVHAKHGYTT
jgi:hypothetical protein